MRGGRPREVLSLLSGQKTTLEADRLCLPPSPRVTGLLPLSTVSTWASSSPVPPPLPDGAGEARPQSPPTVTSTHPLPEEEEAFHGCLLRGGEPRGGAGGTEMKAGPWGGAGTPAPGTALSILPRFQGHVFCVPRKPRVLQGKSPFPGLAPCWPSGPTQAAVNWPGHRGREGTSSVTPTARPFILIYRRSELAACRRPCRGSSGQSSLSEPREAALLQGSGLGISRER